MSEERNERRKKRKAILNCRIREHGLPNPAVDQCFNCLSPVLVLAGIPEESKNNDVTEPICDSISLSPILSLPMDDRNESRNSLDEDDNGTALLPNEAPTAFTTNITKDIELSSSKSSIAVQVALLAAKHNINDVCVRDILRLVCNARFEKTRPPATYKEYETCLGIKKYCADFFWICDICKTVLQVSTFSNPYSKHCCDKKLDERLEHFILLDMKEQVSLAVSGSMSRTPLQTGKRIVMAEQYGCTDADIMVTLNTDGAPLFTSSNSSLWPILGVIDNLTFTEQKKRILLLGLWISKGPKKPNFEIFLSKFITRIKFLHKDYIQWEDSDGMSKMSRIFVSRILCDSIARPAVQMMNQFNAKYGCGYCYHCETGHYYSHQELVLRSNDEHKDICDQVDHDGCSVYGVISKSPLMELEYIDMIKDFPVDVLHVVYLGVVEHFTDKWLSSSSKGRPYFISGEKCNFIDNFLLSIKPPRRVSRLPRSLSQRSSYKGHEWNMWLTYYSPIILEEILPPAYYNHWLLLVNGISQLNCRESELNEEKIHRGGLLLNDFCSSVEKLYDRKSCRFNVHLLRHFELFVKRYGPLHLFSMTIFESYNATLKAYVKSSFGVGKQIIKRYLRDSIVQRSSAEQSFEKNNLLSLNVFKKFELEFKTVYDALQVSASTFKPLVYKSIHVGPRSYYSSTSCKGFRRCSWLYWTCFETVFEVCFYFECKNEIWAFGKEYELKQSDCPVDHIYEIVSNKSSAVKLNTLIGNVIRINYQKTFFEKFINDVECNCE